MQPNVPIQYPTLAAYIEALSGYQVSALNQSVSANFNAVMALINGLQNQVADIEALNANISANENVVANTAHRLTFTGNPP